MNNCYHKHIFTTNKFHGAAFSRYHFLLNELENRNYIPIYSKNALSNSITSRLIQSALSNTVDCMSESF